MAAVAREIGVNALLNMSQMTVSQMSIQNTTLSPQQRQQHENVARHTKACMASRQSNGPERLSRKRRIPLFNQMPKHVVLARPADRQQSTRTECLYGMGTATRRIV